MPGSPSRACAKRCSREPSPARPAASSRKFYRPLGRAASSVPRRRGGGTVTPRKNPRPKVAYPGPRGPGPGRPVRLPRPTTPKEDAAGSLCIHAPVFVDLSNADEIRARVALATLLGSVLTQALTGRLNEHLAFLVTTDGTVVGFS
jgi:hypothetical protein